MSASYDPQQLKASFEENGFLVLRNFVTDQQIAELREEAKRLLESFDQSTISIFTTKTQERKTDQYFLTSGDQIRFFFEEDAFEGDKLKQSLELSINKIGHALHDLNPVFKRFTRQESLCKLARDLGLQKPVVPQSMYIFKQPKIGGLVKPHQDSTYIYTEPMTCTGFWFALEDATKDNGCLWAIPGSHKKGIAKRFVLTEDKQHVTHKPVPDAQIDESEWDEAKFVPLECPKGSLVVLHGSLVHMSYANTSPHSRHAYTFHMFDSAAKYAEDNWLQTGKAFPPMEPVA